MPWDSYHERVGDSPNCFARAIINHATLPKRHALDLGAGHLRDSRYLIREGFARVTAVDCDEKPSSDKFLTGISYVQERMEAFIPKANNFDACVASNALFHCPQASLAEVFSMVKLGLREGGIFSCNLLTEKDAWVREDFDPDLISYVTAKDLPALLEGFHPILCEEVADSKELAKSYKDWHMHMLVLRKK